MIQIKIEILSSGRLLKFGFHCLAFGFVVFKAVLTSKNLQIIVPALPDKEDSTAFQMLVASKDKLMIFCDECEHFPAPDSEKWGDCNKRNYYCIAGVLMAFALPDSPIDDEWGFQKERCRRYQPKPKKEKILTERKPFIPVIIHGKSKR